MSVKHTNSNVKHTGGVVTAPSMGKRIATGALVCVLGLGLVAPYPVDVALAEASSTESASVASDAEADETAKNEVVYAKTNADGSIDGIYVVNKFETTDPTTITDSGTYDSVQNLSTTEQLSDEDGSVTFTTEGGKPFYYQGDLDSSTQLPWDVEVSYTLDGEEISAEDLSGKSGELDIELKVTGVDDGSAESDFANSFLMQAQGTFNNDTFELEEADGATIAAVGNNTAVTYLVLPGEDGDFHIKGKVTDFSYDGWQIAAMPLTMAVDLDDYDTSELTDAIAMLESGSVELANGGESLSAGLAQLDTGTYSALSGSNQLAQGAEQVSGGVDTLSEALASMPGTIQNVQSQLDDIDSQLTDIESDLETLGTSASQLQSLQTTITDDGTAVAGDVQTLGKNVKTAREDVSSAGSSVTSAGTQIGTAAGYINTVLQDPELSETDRKTLTKAYNALVGTDSLTGAAGYCQAAGSSLSDAGTALTAVGGSLQGTTSGTLAYDMGVLSNDLTTLNDSTGPLLQQSATTMQKATQLSSDARTLLNNTESTVDGLSGYLAQVDNLQAGAQQVASGANTLSDGLDQLASGTDEAYSGSQTLASALDTLRDSMDGMDQKVMDELQDKIDELLGSGYELHSFVDPENTDVNEVEFVYVVDGVSDPDDSADSSADDTTASDEDASEDESFGDRLVGLFDRKDDED
jgi:X-X-X-Leu-X-X-Gly heptad repeat protein